MVTVHQGELDLVDGFNKPFHGETRLGDLDGPTFLSLSSTGSSPAISRPSRDFRAISTISTRIC